MSILTASNPLILALVLSLYLVSKESYRILKVKKILICSMVGHFTLILPFLISNITYQTDLVLLVRPLYGMVSYGIVGFFRNLGTCLTTFVLAQNYMFWFVMAGFGMVCHGMVS